jgi:hypothetical protein
VHRNDHTPGSDRPARIPKESVVHFDREIVGAGMWSVVRDRLTEANPEMTLSESESEYRFSGLLMRLAGLLMPGAFRKQSQQHMQDFKARRSRSVGLRPLEASRFAEGSDRVGAVPVRILSRVGRRSAVNAQTGRPPRTG